MPTATYAFVYTVTDNFQGPTPAPQALGPAVAESNTLLDTEDGNDVDNATDGFNEIQVISSSGSRSETLWMVTDDGDPILYDGTSYFLYSNNGDLGNTSVIAAGLRTYTYCFGEGTVIATPQGEIAVETLARGDMVMSAEGDAVPVRWVGRQTIRLRPWRGAGANLVRIAKGALGDGLPHSDLTVTGDHGMILDGMVVNASAMVNHDTIDWVPMADLPARVTVYHIETEAHDVIVANGAASETFIDYVGRRAFDNFAEYVELYGVERIFPEMARPRITTARLLPEALRVRLAGGAAQEALQAS